MIDKFNKMKFKHQSIFAILIAFAVISFWRGVWGLQEEYLFPHDRQLSLIASIIIGLSILIATHYVSKEMM
ncbi:MAG: hypothetical protein JXC85_04580 [Candidatus Aenigmarchaeota archaeon]|nr:hypothetical protein [Candidatus Aenigmarchaeota archaeon]